MNDRVTRLFNESFVPVLLLVLVIAGILLFVQFKAGWDASQVTVVEIPPDSQGGMGEQTTESEEEYLATVPSTSPQRKQGDLLMDEGKWDEAEKLFRQKLAEKRTSATLTDLGVL